MTDVAYRNPRDGKLWKDSKRYKMFLKIHMIAKKVFGEETWQKILNWYNKTFPPKYWLRQVD